MNHTTALILVGSGSLVIVMVLCTAVFLIARRPVAQLRASNDALWQRLVRIEGLFAEEQDWLDNQLDKVAAREAKNLAAVAERLDEIAPAKPRPRFATPTVRTAQIELPPAPPVQLAPAVEALVSPTTYLRLVRKHGLPDADPTLWIPAPEVATVHVEHPLREDDTTTIPAVPAEASTGELVAA